MFLSSTAADLKDHRERVVQAIERLGQTAARMEVFGARPEAPLPECRKLAAECDALVVIVAHRYGWVPNLEEGGDGKRSITWHEVEAALDAHKPVFAFLVDPQATWNFGKESDGLQDAKSEEEAASIFRSVKYLKEFKQFLSERIRDTFTTPDNLASKVSTSLSRWLLEDQPGARVVNRLVIPPQYFEWLQSECGGIDLLGMQVKDGRAVRISNVYVPLTTAASDRQGKEKRSHSIREELDSTDREMPQLLLELLDRNSLYVSGAAGSGKSTFCRWVACLACADSVPSHQVCPDEDHLAEPYPESFRGRLPLLVRLRDFWDVLPKTPGRQDLSAAELSDALADWFGQRKPGGLEALHAKAHLKNGSALLILDGVDEVPITVGEGRGQARPRAMLLSGLSAAMAAWTDQGNRVLVTSRPYGLTETETKRLGLKQASINDLDAELQQLLIRRWFHCLMENAEEAEATAEGMWQHVRALQGIAELASNPLLLTAMCIIYHEGKRLPQDRHDLYDRIVKTVLYGRYPSDPVEIDLVRNRLAVVAYGMHTGEGLGEQRTEPQAELTVSEIDQIIQVYQDQKSWTETGYKGAIEAREQLLTRTGLLLPRGERQAGFYHLTLQDFLAAQRLLDLHEETLLEVFRERGAVAEWRSTLSFVCGAQLAKHSSPHRTITLLSRLVESLHQDDLRLGVVLGDCLQLLLKRGVRLKDEAVNIFRDFCVSAINREVVLQERFQLAIALGRVGDPRIETDIRNPAAYVEVPAGTYRVGGDPETYETLDETTFEVRKPFLLSRYPVTNAQYALFIEECGYGQRKWWSDAGWKWREQEDVKEPEYWHDATWNSPNKPVVGVSYWEAEAFAKWAEGFLPSEQQWEAAARGPEGLEYPWGNKWEDGICNNVQAGLGGTSPVGLFPRSRSRDLELEDMAGNVSEWCDSDYQEGSEGRVLRGGSFVDAARVARSANRGGYHPTVRSDVVGFRSARTYPLTAARDAVA